MFQEKEAGKPKSWGCLVAIIVIVTLFNLAVIITIRALLDSEDEFDVPIIEGEMREYLTYFLGIFTMTFFFGCCCCFCCGCSCCRWIGHYVLPKIFSWCQELPHMLVYDVAAPITRFRESGKRGDAEDLNQDVVQQAGGVPVTILEEKISDKCAYENTAFNDILEMDRLEVPRLVLPPMRDGRLRSHSIDISSAM